MPTLGFIGGRLALSCDLLLLRWLLSAATVYTRFLSCQKKFPSRHRERPHRVLKNRASRRDPALCGFCKCVVCPKIEGLEAGKLEAKPFMPFF